MGEFGSYAFVASTTCLFTIWPEITAKDWETNVENSWGNLPQNLFGGERHFAPKNPKGKISVCPEIFAMAEDPKATLLGKRSIMPILRFFFH